MKYIPLIFLAYVTLIGNLRNSHWSDELIVQEEFSSILLPKAKSMLQVQAFKNQSSVNFTTAL